jgi:predicted membrane chloride channel (bestrophin family)
VRPNIHNEAFSAVMLFVYLRFNVNQSHNYWGEKVWGKIMKKMLKKMLKKALVLYDSHSTCWGRCYDHNFRQKTGVFSQKPML